MKMLPSLSDICSFTQSTFHHYPSMSFFGKPKLSQPKVSQHWATDSVVNAIDRYRCSSTSMTFSSSHVIAFSSAIFRASHCFPCWLRLVFDKFLNHACEILSRSLPSHQCHRNIDCPRLRMWQQGYGFFWNPLGVLINLISYHLLMTFTPTGGKAAGLSTPTALCD